MLKITNLDQQVSVSEQISANDIATLVRLGVEIIVCNRPDNEETNQPSFAGIEKTAKASKLAVFLLDFSGKNFSEEQVEQFAKLIASGKRIHAYCRTGNRSTKIWQQAQLRTTSPAANENLHDKIHPKSETSAIQRFDIVIIGAGSAGLACAASLIKRDNKLSIAIVDPAEAHYYQPGWTMVSGGVFSVESTGRKTKDLIPKQVKQWLQHAVIGFEPEQDRIILDNGTRLAYEHLIVAPGLHINWAGIPGLQESLGKNGVTSNYSHKTAPYTRQLIKQMQGGKALFTQPPMPIKCAGAPQKAMYLACSHWYQQGIIKRIETHFYNSGAVLFGVKDYVPALEKYVQKYAIQLHFQHTLVKVDGEKKIASLKTKDDQGNEKIIESDFDMLHVTPPQQAPTFIKMSSLADKSGWLEVDQYTLQHTRFVNIWGAGDVINAPNAKTMAAARKQVPVVAHNITQVRKGKTPNALYDGYGSCPLTVEEGKIILAEFGYGGKLLHTFPDWVINGTQPSRLAWKLKSSFLPAFYWKGMLHGHEWFAEPTINKS